MTGFNYKAKRGRLHPTRSRRKQTWLFSKRATALKIYRLSPLAAILRSPSLFGSKINYCWSAAQNFKPLFQSSTFYSPLSLLNVFNARYTLFLKHSPSMANNGDNNNNDHAKRQKKNDDNGDRREHRRVEDDRGPAIQTHQIVRLNVGEPCDEPQSAAAGRPSPDDIAATSSSPDLVEIVVGPAPVPFDIDIIYL